MKSVVVKYLSMERDWSLPENAADDTARSDLIFSEILRHNECYLSQGILPRLQFRENLPSGSSPCRYFINRQYCERLMTSHSHDYAECNLVLHGTLYESVNDTAYVLHDGDMLIMGSGSVFHSPYTEKDAEVRNIALSPELFSDLLDTARFLPSFLLRSVKDKETYIILRGIPETVSGPFIRSAMPLVSSLHELTAAEQLYAEELLKTFFAHLQMLKDSGTVTEETGRIGFRKRSAETVLQYIDEHYADVTLSELVRVFGYSERQIQRIIRESSGSDLRTEVMVRRIQRAQYLLTSTDLPISRIAEAVGLDSVPYFSRMFHIQTGMTALRYRKTQRENPASLDESLDN